MTPRTSDGAPGQALTREGDVSQPYDVVAEHLSVEYGVGRNRFEVLRDVSFHIAPSEFVCAVGLSGSGKTTLLNVLAGFVHPTSGVVLVGGRKTDDAHLRRGYVFQEYGLFPWLTVIQNIEVGLRARGAPRGERQGLALQYLETVGLTEFRSKYPHQLSGGMRQRTAVARALAFDPPMMLFDEPFGALDAFTRERLQRLVADLSVRTRKTFVYVTHNISEAVFLADRVMILTANPGRVTHDIIIDIPRPRDDLSEPFREAIARIRDAIYEHAPTSREGDEKSQMAAS